MCINFIYVDNPLTIFNLFNYLNADYNLYICADFNIIAYDYYYRSY